jgi:hypothetical protein
MLIFDRTHKPKKRKRRKDHDVGAVRKAEANVVRRKLYVPTYWRKKMTRQSSEDKENLLRDRARNREKVQQSFDATTAKAELEEKRMAKEAKEAKEAKQKERKGKKGKGKGKGKAASVEEWRKTKIASPNLFEHDTSTDFLLHGSEKQQGATRIFDEEVVQWLKKWFPQYTGLWGDCTACFAEQASKQWGNDKQTIAKILVIMFFATKRMFGKSGQRQPAVLHKNKTSTQDEGSNSVYDHCVQEVLHSYSNVRAQCVADSAGSAHIGRAEACSLDNVRTIIRITLNRSLPQHTPDTHSLLTPRLVICSTRMR